jgi:hypothetical protein
MRFIMEKILHLIDQDIPPNQILALTFSDKTAAGDRVPLPRTPLPAPARPRMANRSVSSTLMTGRTADHRGEGAVHAVVEVSRPCRQVILPKSRPHRPVLVKKILLGRNAHEPIRFTPKP